MKWLSSITCFHTETIRPGSAMLSSRDECLEGWRTVAICYVGLNAGWTGDWLARISAPLPPALLFPPPSFALSPFTSLSSSHSLCTLASATATCLAMPRVAASSLGCFLTGGAKLLEKWRAGMDSKRVRWGARVGAGRVCRVDQQHDRR